MEKIMYPSLYIRITQSYGVGSHKSIFAIDDGGSDNGIDYLIAPFTGTIRKIYKEDANEVWLESSDKVLYADGTIDYATVMLAHDNDVSNLYIGKLLKQGQRFYEEGTRGKTTGNHCHIEIGKGKFNGSGWYKNSSGVWEINNAKKPEDCFFIDNNYHIIDTKNLIFKNINTLNTTNTQKNNGKNYINLPYTVDSWRVYPLTVNPIKTNAIAVLKPKKYGGLTYYIYSYRDNNTTVEINTANFGRVKIYIANTSAQITIDNPLYKYGEY